MKTAATAPSRVVLDVSLPDVEENFRKSQRNAAPLGVIVVLKADAYGLGMPAIARRLVAAGAAGIATAELAEGLAALEATGGRVPVGVLGALFGIAATEGNPIILFENAARRLYNGIIEGMYFAGYKH